MVPVAPGKLIGTSGAETRGTGAVRALGASGPSIALWQSCIPPQGDRVKK